MAPPNESRSPRPGSGLSVLDLAQIRALVESTSIIGGSTCPSCEMPFDKGKKRRLIDSCGHERCYSCLFRSEACPMCRESATRAGDEIPRDRYPCENRVAGFRSSEPVSMLAENDDQRDDPFAINSPCGSPRPPRGTRVRPKGAIPPPRGVHAENVTSSGSAGATGKVLKTKPPVLPESIASQARQKAPMMAQSCPTPPNQRKRFFLNSKVLRGPFASQRAARRDVTVPEPTGNENPSALSDDEGGCVGPLSTKARKSSQSDLYMRLGLLLGSGNLGGGNTGVDAMDLPEAASERPIRDSGACPRAQIRGPNDVRGRGDATSVSSLTSYETRMLASNNTSPVSTLTGTSSEAEVAAAIGSPTGKPKGKGSRGKEARDCDSAGSLASISTSVSASTSMSMSMSVSVSGLSNGSGSPSTSRRHSAANRSGQFDEYKSRRSCVRRSARGCGPGGGLIETRPPFVQHPGAQLTLKPLFFEVPLTDPNPPFTGRQWLLQEFETVIGGSSPGVLLSGSPGTGKTALVLELVEHSCFGRRRREESHDSIEEMASGSYTEPSIRRTNEKIRELASRVVAYHFCQADNNTTCLVPDFIHSLAAQLCQAPQLVAYREYLLSEPHLQGSLSQRECTVDSDLALSRGIIEPLTSLGKSGRLPEVNMVILIDAVCEAEYHRPDRGDTIATFLARHAPNFPSWLKIVCTVRSQLLERCAKQLPYTRISLDANGGGTSGANVARDLSDYVGHRLTRSPSIRANVTASINGKAESTCGANQTRFASHLLALAGGSFLFAKLTLDLIESGHLVAKSASYKVLPVSLAQIYQLHFNLRYPTAASFDKVQPILGVCLAALYPLTLPEIYYSVNSLYVDRFISWEDFAQRFESLSGFIVKRLDDTYMFFHPSFREWLMRRDEGESTKFLCDLRLGHAAIAFRLSRLQSPLDGEKVLELGHHVLKAHVYRGISPRCWPSRDLQALWLTISAECVSQALCTLRNIYGPNAKVSRLLLLAGASPDCVTDCLGNAPALCMYAHEGSVEMVSLLLEFGADVELTNSQGCTALSLAAARGHCDVVRRLVAAGASLGHADTAGRCSLVHAARNGRLSVVGYLLACDWVPAKSESSIREISSIDGKILIGREDAAQQAVVAAASRGHEPVVEYLLDMAEVAVDGRDSLVGETALTVAAAHGATATVSALLARGADPLSVNSKGLSALMLAAREGHRGTAERLLRGSLSSDADANRDDAIPILLDQRDTSGRTALSLAAAEGRCELVELLLHRGAILEATDNEGLGALGWACVRGRLGLARILLDRGADVNASDNIGRTPLDLAAFQGNPKLVQLLLERGAAIEHVDLRGMRPLDRAIGCRNLPVVQCFLRRGAKLGPATWTMAAGKPDVLLILLNKLLEDGNVLYRKGRLKEASHRYSYALRKFPDSPQGIRDNQSQERNNSIVRIETFAQLRLNFLLNLSRCKRKMNECEEAIELAEEALELRPDSYEAFYARAKARADVNRLEEALSDAQQALRIASIGNKQDRRVLAALNDEIISRLEGTGMGCSKDPVEVGSSRFGFGASIDTLTEL